MRVILLLGVLLTYSWFTDARNIVCFFDSKGLHRFGQSRFTLHDLQIGLRHCTHLIYGYAGIEEGTGKLAYLDAYSPKDVVEQNYQQIIRLKSQFPGLKILISVGGGADADRSKYMTLLETAASRARFVESALQYIQNHGFDGLDLAWEFLETKPQGPKSVLVKTFNKLTSVFKKSTEDKKSDEHREQFSNLVKQLRTAFTNNRLLTLTVIPNVNATVYYDVRRLSVQLDQVHLMSYDYSTPERNPEEADYTAPLNTLIDRKLDANGNAQVRYWLDNGAAPNQVIYGIPTFARTFKMTKSSGKSGIPPLEIEGPGEAGPFTKEAGLLSYGEVCLKLNDDQNGYQRVSDTHGGSGSYAYRIANGTTPGIWVGFDDLETVAKKASFVKQKNLGGVAISDLTLDDFKGLCTAVQYPILTTVQKYL